MHATYQLNKDEFDKIFLRYINKLFQVAVSAVSLFIAQAMTGDMALVSHDTAFSAYPVLLLPS